jgi:hypothetical protein
MPKKPPREPRPSGQWKRALPAGIAISMAALAPVSPLAAGSNVWTAVGPSGGPVTALLVDPVDPQVVYAGTTGGVFKSSSAGASWQAASRGMKVHPVTALAIDPLSHRTLHAAAGDGFTAKSGVWASRNGVDPVPDPADALQYRAWTEGLRVTRLLARASGGRRYGDASRGTPGFEAGQEVGPPAQGAEDVADQELPGDDSISGR